MVQLPADFAPFDQRFWVDPYRAFMTMRQTAPVFYAPEIGHWIVSRYKDVSAIFMDHGVFSAANTLTPIKQLCPAAMQALADGNCRIRPVLGSLDRPRHTVMRNLVSRFFTPSYLRSLEPFIRETCDAAVSQLAIRDDVDLVGELLGDLPAKVILGVLGFSGEIIEVLIAGARHRNLFIWGWPDDAEQTALAEGMASLFNSCLQLVAERSAAPRADLVSDLIKASRELDVPVDNNMLASILLAFFTAGHETSASMAANAVREILRHEGCWARLCSEPELIPNAIEEALRFQSSVVSWRRQAKRDIDIAGVTIPAGAQILMLIGAANRDDAMFDRPDEFDLERAAANRYLSFGKGIHFCIGNGLARMELRIILEGLTNRFPQMRLAASDEPEYLPNIAFRQPLSLWVNLHGEIGSEFGR